MYRCEPLLSITMCPNRPLLYGQARASYRPYSCRAASEDSKSLAMEIVHSLNERKQSKCATVGCLPIARKKILSDRFNTCKLNTLDGRSILTSEAASTGREAVCVPFFDDVCKEISSALQWHTKTDLRDLDTKLLSSCWQKMESNCCATVKKFINPKKTSLQKTSSASSQSSARVFMVNESTTRIRKVILLPSKDVHVKLKRWMGCCRVTYNDALRYIKKDNIHKKTMFWLRNRFVNSCNIPGSKCWLLDTPKHVREGAIKDLAQAFDTNFKVKKKKPGHKFEIGFRSKKDEQSIVLPKSSIKIVGGKLKLYPTFLGQKPIPICGSLPIQTIKHDCRLVYDRLGRWVLHIPTDLQKKIVVSDNQARVVAVDPGVRTFATCWSSQEEGFKLGDGDASRLYRLLLHMDRLMLKTKASSGKTKHRMNIALQRMRVRYDNIVKDLHYQVSNFLLKRYDTVIIPAFGVKKMTARQNRRIRTKTVRSMLGLSHFKFRQRLQEVAQRWGAKVDVCTEEYTTKTCGRCGWLHHTIGGSKVFNCQQCHLKMDRDLTGAINIFLKRLRECLLNTSKGFANR